MTSTAAHPNSRTDRPAFLRRVPFTAGRRPHATPKAALSLGRWRLSLPPARGLASPLRHARGSAEFPAPARRASPPHLH